MAQMTLDGKVAVVTGGSRGIGLAIGRAYAAAGATVVLSSRKQDALESAIAESDPAVQGRMGAIAAHAGDPDQLGALMEATLSRFGAVDILVNNAATSPYMGPSIDIDFPRFDKTWEVNYRGQFAAVQAAWQAWMRDHGGNVVNIASIGGLSVEPAIGHYNATKAALMHLTRTLAFELAPAVRVNAIAPGLVKTDMARALWEANEAAIAKMIPMQRLGEPSDIADAAVFLASDASSWITGHTLVVDGGMMLGVARR